MTETCRALLERAIQTYGAPRQIMKAVEELGELSAALGRFEGARDAVAPEYNRLLDNLAEEIADVRVMLDQLCLIYDLEGRADQWRMYKLDRLYDRLNVKGGPRACTNHISTASTACG